KPPMCRVGRGLRALRLRAVGEGGFDGGQVQGLDDPPPFPRDLAPEIAEGGTGLFVGALHLGIAVVEHEHAGRLGFTHGVTPSTGRVGRTTRFRGTSDSGLDTLRPSTTGRAKLPAGVLSDLDAGTRA